jgi:hypothetical protein
MKKAIIIVALLSLADLKVNNHCGTLLEEGLKTWARIVATLENVDLC